MMKTKLMTILLVAAAMMACTSNKTAKDATEEQTASACTKEITIANKWQLVDFATTDSVAQAADKYVLQFNAEDSTFSMNTDCNSISGQYVVNGDSIKFENVAMTMMACPENDVERAMAAVFATVDTYAVRDHALVLRSDMRTMATFKLVCPKNGCKHECGKHEGCKHEGCTGDCKGNCKGECTGDCTGDCKGECNGNCKGNCTGNCKGECTGDCK